MARGASRLPQACDAASITPVNNSLRVPILSWDMSRYVPTCPKKCPGHVPGQARRSFAGAGLQASNPGQCPANRIEKNRKRKRQEEETWLENKDATQRLAVLRVRF
jgi:hypothetical protein